MPTQKDRYPVSRNDALIRRVINTPPAIRVTEPPPAPSADTTAADAGWQGEPDPEVVPVGLEERLED